MGRYLSDIEASVRDVLRDEFVEGVDLEWETDEIHRLIRLTLDEMEQKMPYEVKVIAEDELTQIATELSASATTLIVDSDDDFSTTYPFYITIENEVLSVTALASADNFTVTRAQLGSTAAVHVVDKSVGLTIVTTENSKEIDLSNISGLIRVRKWKGVEYRIARPSYNPKQFRNWARFGDTLTMDINIVPSDKEEVHLYCFKKHTLTNETSTLKTDHETILILGTTARAARNKGREQLGALNTGGVNVGPRMIEVGERWKQEYEKELKRNITQDIWGALPKD